MVEESPSTLSTGPATVHDILVLVEGVDDDVI